jgi:enterochelin esterase-like enzyme
MRIFALALTFFLLAGCAPAPQPVIGGTNTPAPPTVSVPTLLPSANPSPSPTAFPSPSATPEQCTETRGTIHAESLQIAPLPRPVRVDIYLPACYEWSEQTYPVLYLFHGQGYAEDQWQRLGAIETLERLASAGEISPFIVVMPWEDYIPNVSEPVFRTAMLEWLFPHIEAAYRVNGTRGIGGLSRGAGWALHFGLRNPDNFVAIGAHSPIIFADDTVLLRERLIALATQNPPQFFVDIGAEDRQPEAAFLLEKLLAQFQIPHDWRYYTGSHEEVYWSAHVEEYMRWYAQVFATIKP